MTDLPLPIDRAVWNAHRTLKGTCWECGTFKIPKMNRWPDPVISTWPDNLMWGHWTCECDSGIIWRNECRVQPVHACDESYWLAYHLWARDRQMRWRDVAALIDWPCRVEYLRDLCQAWADDNHMPWPPRERTT